MYDEFASRDAAVIAIAQEDTDLESHAKMFRRFDPAPRFGIVADLKREKTAAYKRTTAYLIDPEGIVRQVFPMMIHHRPSWKAIINELDRVKAAEGK